MTHIRRISDLLNFKSSGIYEFYAPLAQYHFLSHIEYELFHHEQWALKSIVLIQKINVEELDINSKISKWASVSESISKVSSSSLWNSRFSFTTFFTSSPHFWSFRVLRVLLVWSSGLILHINYENFLMKCSLGWVKWFWVNIKLKYGFSNLFLRVPTVCHEC